MLHLKKIIRSERYEQETVSSNLSKEGKYIEYKRLFSSIKYHKENVCFVAATKEANKDSSYIVMCDPEKKGDWNNKEEWFEAIQKAKTKLK